MHQLCVYIAPNLYRRVNENNADVSRKLREALKRPEIGPYVLKMKYRMQDICTLLNKFNSGLANSLAIIKVSKLYA